MKSIAITLIGIWSAIKCDIEILTPAKLRNAVQTSSQTPHFIDYSVSLFGEMLYNERNDVQIIYPGDENQHGCNHLKAPTDLIRDKFVWLLKRGNCTYSMKAYSVQQSGAIAALVYHDDPLTDIINIIPCGDSVCKVIRQQYSNSCYSHSLRGWRAHPRRDKGRQKRNDGSENRFGKLMSPWSNRKPLISTFGFLPPQWSHTSS